WQVRPGERLGAVEGLAEACGLGADPVAQLARLGDDFELGVAGALFLFVRSGFGSDGRHSCSLRWVSRPGEGGCRLPPAGGRVCGGADPAPPPGRLFEIAFQKNTTLQKKTPWGFGCVDRPPPPALTSTP